MEEENEIMNTKIEGSVNSENKDYTVEELHDALQNVVLRKKLPSLPTREETIRRRTLKRKITEEEAWGKLSNDATAQYPLTSSNLKIQQTTFDENDNNKEEKGEEEGEEGERKEGEGEGEGEERGEKRDERKEEGNTNNEETTTNEKNEVKRGSATLREELQNEEYFEYYNEEAMIEPDGSKAIALWAFKGECESDLSFQKGDIITIIRKYDNGWWEGEVNGVIGDFPFNFVEVLTYENDEDDEGDEDDSSMNTTTPQITSFSSSPSSPSSSLSSSQVISHTIQSSSSSSLSSSSSDFSNYSKFASSVQHRSEILSTRPLSTPKALPIKQGYLLKKGHKRRNWKVRYFVLENSKLSYYANPQDASTSKRMKGFLTLQKTSSVKLAPEMRKSNCFAVYTDTKPFVIYITAPTGDDMVSWMESISMARSM